MKTRSESLFGRAAWLIPVGAVVYAFLLCRACHLRFIRCAYDDFDLAVHAQSTWNLLHGSLGSSILGVPFLGNHMVLILFGIAPLYALFPSPLTLLYLQSLALAAGAWGVFLLARTELPAGWRLAPPLLYLIYPPLLFMNLYEFHPVALATVFLIYALYFFRCARFRPFLLFLVLTLLCQENLSLVAVGFGVYALLAWRPARWVVLPLGMGAAWFVLTVLVVMPRLNPAIQFARLYPQLGDSVPGVLTGLVTRPGVVVRSMAQPAKLGFLNSLLAPIAYLGLLGPLSFVPVLPVLAQRLLSQRLSETTIVYHYQAEFIPFVFAATIAGLRRALRARRRVVRPLLAALLTGFPLAALCLTGILPRVLTPAGGPAPEAVRRVDAFLDRFPARAPVAATFEFLPRLANRPRLYSLHHVYADRYTLSSVPYPVPVGLEAVILNTNDRLTFLDGAFYGLPHYRNLQAIFRDGDWRVVEHVGSVLVIRKVADAAAERLGLLERLDADPEMNRRVRQTGPGPIRLVGFRAGEIRNNVLALRLYWRRSPGRPTDCDMLLAVYDGSRLLYRGRLSPGSRIFPPQSWPATGVIADRQAIPLQAPVRDAAELRLEVTLVPPTA